MLRKYSYGMLVGLFVFLTLSACEQRNDHLIVGNTEISVDVVRTDRELERGLSGRRGLCDTCGMFFVFSSPADREFWMRDMLFDIDIIWILDDEIIHISENVDHVGGEEVRVGSGQPVDRVLEVPAGFVADHGIRVGQRIQYFQSVFE